MQPVCVEGVAHDMMLDCSWEKGAEIMWWYGLSNMLLSIATLRKHNEIL